MKLCGVINLSAAEPRAGYESSWNVQNKVFWLRLQSYKTSNWKIEVEVKNHKFALKGF